VTLTLDESSLVEQQKAELLFREARQRRRRRWVSRISIAVAVVLAGLALGIGLWLVRGPASHPYQSNSIPLAGTSSQTGATLVYASDNVRVFNADSGASRSLPLPAPAGGSSDLSMVKVGSSVVLNRGNRAWLYGPGLDGPPVDLGPSLRVIPGPADDQIWIWSDPCAEGLGCSYADTEPQNGVMQLVGASGDRVGLPIPLPVDANWFPTGQTVNAGIVLSIAYGPGLSRDEIWNPTSNHVVRALPDGVIATHGDLIASGDGNACHSNCAIQITNVETGKGQTILLPPGTDASGLGAYSPDGSTLAFAVGPGGSRSQWPTTIVVVSVRTGAVRVLSGTEQGIKSYPGDPNISWSNTGWLFVDEIGSTHLLAWRSGNASAEFLPSVKLPPLGPPQSQTGSPSMIAL